MYPSNPNPYEPLTRSLPPLPPPPNRSNRINAALIGSLITLIIVAVIVVAFRFTGQPTSSSQGFSTGGLLPTATPTSNPTIQNPTATTGVSQPTVLYNANWANGFAGWQPDTTQNSAWSVTGGTLVNDGSSCCILLAPFHPTSLNFAIETRLQMGTCTNSLGGSFGLFGHGIPATHGGGIAGYIGYWGTSDNYKIRTIPYWSLTGDGWQTLGEVPSSIDTNFHTFRMEFQNNYISFLVDGKLELQIADTQYAGTTVGIEDWFCPLIVTSFTIYSL